MTSPSSLPRVSFRTHISNKQAKIQAGPSKKNVCSSEHLNQPTLNHLKRKNGKRKAIGVLPIRPEDLAEHELFFVEQGRAENLEVEIEWDPKLLPVVNTSPPQTLMHTPLPVPSSCSSFYQSLLTLISNPHKSPEPLAVLTAYHSRQQFRGLRSTRSYNLLISFAIRHASFGTAKKLLMQMYTDGLDGDLENWKLKVRLMVRCGQWGIAWKSVMRVLEQRQWKHQLGLSDDHGNGMPLAIWMEFFTTIKRGAIREWTNDGMRVVEENHVDRTEGALGSLDSRRLKLLMQHAPSLTPKEYTRMPARAVYFIVWMMLRAGHLDDARNMTRAYLAGLPTQLAPREVRAALDVLHLHIPWGSTKRSPLAEHYDVRRTLEMFLAMHKALKPDSRTLFLLLRSLKRTTYSGTLARQVANSFRRKWGSHTESERVRRRITALALKEGNLALANRELNQESRNRAEHNNYAVQTEVLGSSGHGPLLRPPLVTVFTKRGAEVRRWRHLKRKVRFMRPIGAMTMQPGV